MNSYLTEQALRRHAMLYLYLKRDMLFTCYSIQAGGVHHWCGIYSDVMGSQALRVDLPAHVQLIGDDRHRGDGRGVAWHQYLLREVRVLLLSREMYQPDFFIAV